MPNRTRRTSLDLRTSRRIILTSLLALGVFFGGIRCAVRLEIFPCQAASSHHSAKYPLHRLKLLRFVLQMLQHRYVDPTQFSPKQMFDGALSRLEREVDSFHVRRDLKKKRLILQLGPHQKELKIKRFLGLFDVWLRLRPVAAFLKQHYRGKLSLSDLEFAMVSGVMSTLDKQTQLVDPRRYQRRHKRRKRGKIGVILRISKRRLWIVRVLPDSPADYAGLKAGDEIIAINDEPLKGRDLWEMIRKIGGYRGTRVALLLKRKSWPKARRIVLIRAAITTPNVTGALLPGKIGYVRLRAFIRGSSLAIKEQLAHLRQLAKGPLLGLILDLRNNPGGLVREAVAIASLFVEKGEVTTYAGANTKRRTYHVNGQATEERYPMIVLLSGHSASASELLSGALKNHDRAVIMGRQSYGKGTVQLAGPLRHLGLYFRITIAQYMIPGNQSIQGVGVIPDIEVLPISLRPNHVRYFSLYPRDQAARRKRWPRFLLQNLSPDDAEKSLYQLHYLASTPSRDNQRTKKPKRNQRKRRNAQRRAISPKRWFIDPHHALGPDFEVWLARYLLVHAKSGRRQLFLQQIKRRISRLKRRLERQIVRTLRAQRINWTRPRKLPRHKPQLSAHLQLVHASKAVQTGRPFQLKLTVKNIGHTTVYRVHAILYASSPTLRYRELLIGRLPPGRTRTQTLQLTLPNSALSRVELLRCKVYALGLKQPTLAQMALAWTAPARPRYAFSLIIQDPSPDGNGDGRLQAGERAKLILVTRNVSQTPSPAVRLLLRADRFLIHRPKIDLGPLAPGVARTHTFSIQVPDNASVGRSDAHIYLYDRKLRYFIKHRLPLRIAKAFSGLTQPASGWAHLTTRTRLHNAPEEDALTIALAAPGTTLRVLRRWGTFVKVQLPASFLPQPPPQKQKAPSRKTKKRRRPANERPPTRLTAWLHQRVLKLMPTGTLQAAGLKLHYQLRPPRIQIGWKGPPYLIKTAKTTLPLTIDSSQGIKDVILWRDQQKIAYRAIQYRHPQGHKRLTIKLPLALKPGVHRMRLYVRTASGRYHHTFYITRAPK